MKRLTWLSLFVALALVLSACGGGGATDTVAPGGEITQPPMEATTAAPMEPTEAMTEPPMEETEAPTEMATEAPTEAPTEAATLPPADVDVSAIDCGDTAEGDEVTMLYQWSGLEEEQLRSILAPLEEACGIVFNPESTRDQGLLETRVQSGNPPDIAFWNIAQLEQYQDQLIPIEDMGIDTTNYADFWTELGSIGGTWFGLPVKADVKSIIWYNPVAFEAFGYTVPTTWDELDALVEQMVADGNVPWSMGFESGDATGWTGSDFIQDILLVTQGPDFVRGLISGETPYNDPAVAEAYEIYAKWASDPAYTVGGADGTLSTNFNDAILQVFADPPEALMVKQSGFAGGTITGTYPDLEFGTDYDFFQVPDVQGVQGGSDWMMAFSDEPAVLTVFRYLSSPVGAEAWAEAGFGLTPNQAAAESIVDPVNAKLADILYGAETLVPDIGDSIPGGFGSLEWAAIIDVVSGGDIATNLEAPADMQAQQVGQ